MSQNKAPACTNCTDFWDCSGNCSYRSREKRGGHSQDEQTMFKDLDASRKNFRAQVNRKRIRQPNGLNETIVYLQNHDIQSAKRLKMQQLIDIL